MQTRRGFAGKRHEAVALKLQIAPARQHIDVIRLQDNAVVDLDERHVTDPGEDFAQTTVVARGQMQHQYEGHAGVRRQRAQKLGEGLDPARRRAYAHHRKIDPDLLGLDQ